LQDIVDTLDVEMARLSVNILFVARYIDYTPSLETNPIMLSRSERTSRVLTAVVPLSVL